MADNTTIQRPTTNGDIISTEDVGGIKIPRGKVVLGDHGTDGGDVSSSNPLPVSAASLPLPTGAATAANQTSGNTSLSTLAGAVSGSTLVVVGLAVCPSSNFTRPNNTTAYASGQLIANSVTAGSVTPLSWTAARVAAGSGFVRRARLVKSGTTITNATFRLHLYGASPTVANGDGAAWSTNRSSYIGSVDLDMTASTGRVFTDSAEVIGIPAVGNEINFTLTSGQTIYGLLEARAAYTPVAQEVFTVELEIVQN